MLTRLASSSRSETVKFAAIDRMKRELFALRQYCRVPQPDVVIRTVSDDEADEQAEDATEDFFS